MADDEPAVRTAPDDDRLLAIWRGADERGFDLLVRAHGADVYSFLCRLTRDEALAAEAYSETFLKVFRTHAQGADGHFRPWLFTIARRAAQDALRSERRRGRVAAALADERPDPCADSPSDAMVEVEAARALWSLIDTLPEPHRSVVILRYRHDFDSPEIAAILELTEKQVRDKLVYARRILRTALTPE